MTISLEKKIKIVKIVKLKFKNVSEICLRRGLEVTDFNLSTLAAFQKKIYYY